MIWNICFGDLKNASHFPKKARNIFWFHETRRHEKPWSHISHCLDTSHSAYVATETELYGAKIDGLLPPNFL